jgi:hypothetical protein
MVVLFQQRPDKRVFSPNQSHKYSEKYDPTNCQKQTASGECSQKQVKNSPNRSKSGDGKETESFDTITDEFFYAIIRTQVKSVRLQILERSSSTSASGEAGGASPSFSAKWLQTFASFIFEGLD